jgi:hypothetical protein
MDSGVVQRNATQRDDTVFHANTSRGEIHLVYGITTDISTTVQLFQIDINCNVVQNIPSFVVIIVEILKV